MDRCAEAEEVEDIKEQIRLAIEWVTNSRGREQPRWIMPPGTEEENRRESLARARRLVERGRKQCPEVEEDQEGGRPSKWRGLQRGGGGQMRFRVGMEMWGSRKAERKAGRGMGKAGSQGRRQTGRWHKRRTEKG